MIFLSDTAFIHTDINKTETQDIYRYNGVRLRNKHKKFRRNIL